MKAKLIEKFVSIYGEGGEIRSFFSPGRVNLIGEHTDYNGGHVFPCALSIGTYMIVRKREDRTIRFYSENFSKLGVIETSLDDLVYSEKAGWTNYPKGVMWAIEGRGYKIPTGMDILIYGTIPNGSGLSSSASLEVLTGLAVRDLFGFEGISMIDLALIGQYSENNFNGCNCGIMDQFAVAMGKKDHAIFLDTSDLSYEYASVKLENAKIVITNSKVKHSLVDSAYNDRRNECETALKELQTVVDIKGLGDLSEEEFEKYKDAIKDPVRQKRAHHAVYENQRTIQAVAALNAGDVEKFEKYKDAIKDPVRQKRAHHAVYENQRTIQAVAALNAGDVEKFGKLMNASHVSLRDDYEVSCEEIDVLVDLAWETEGVIGSRITGGGFGGCTVSIVKNDAVDHFIDKLGKAYKEKTGHEAEFYVVEIGDGAKEI